MQITINETEIKQAIKIFIADQGIAIVGKSVEVNLTAGRGPNGMTASVDIVQGTGGGPKKSANTMQEGFALKTKKEVEVEKTVEEIDKILDTEAAKPIEEELDPDAEPDPGKHEPVPAGQDDVDSLFGG